MRCFIYSRHTTNAGNIFYYTPANYDNEDIEDLENSADFVEFKEEDVPFAKEVLMRSKNMFDIKVGKNVIKFFEGQCDV